MAEIKKIAVTDIPGLRIGQIENKEAATGRSMPWYFPAAVRLDWVPQMES